MNRIFNVIWSSVLKCMIVVSELSGNKSRIQSQVNNTNYFTVNRNKYFLLSATCSAVLLGLAGISDVSAATLNVPVYTPEANSELQGQYIITGNDTLTDNGTMGYNAFARGKSSYTTQTLQEILAEGFITSGAEYVNDDRLMLGGKSQSISYTDPVTGAVKTMTVYDSDGMSVDSMADFERTVITGVGRHGQYVNMRLATIRSGGTLNVNVGSTAPDWYKDPRNFLNILLKNSAVYQAEADPAATSDAVINYNSKTIFDPGTKSNSFHTDTVTFTPADFSGTFTSKIGVQSVNSLADFQAYNNALIQAVKNGTLSASDYETQLNLAYDNNTRSIVIDSSNAINSDDAALLPISRNSSIFIRAKGSRAQVNVTPDAEIIGLGQGTVVWLEDGATLNNSGRIGIGNTSASGGYAVYAADSVINNSGVIDVGYTDLDGKGLLGENKVGIVANNSRMENSGVVNVTGVTQYTNTRGIDLLKNSTLNNSGTINVSVEKGTTAPLTPDTGNELYASVGVNIQSGSAINKGTVYIGREGQQSVTDLTTDIATFWRSIGVYLRGNNSSFINDAGGNITIGTLAQNSTAIFVNGVNRNENPHVEQNGTININGHINSDAPLENVGILSTHNAKDVINNGTINLNGINSVGIKVTDGSQAGNAGTINVNGGADALSGTRNTGMWVQDAGSAGTLSGTVNMTGDGAIGIHARDAGVINVTGNGAVNFSNGTHQTGYFIYGKNSAINNTTTGVQDVSSDDSVLYRIDGGATYTGSSSGASDMLASGAGSSVIQATGSGTTFNSGDMHLDVTGAGATGVRIEGGAQGTLTGNADLTVSGNGATAGIVDGNYYDPDGNIVSDKSGHSVLTSDAILNSSNAAVGTMGYIVRNAGELIHKGTIDFTGSSGSTGVLVDGGTLTNSGTIRANGTAVNIEGKNSQASNSGTVSATDGIAAWRLGDGASLALYGSGTTNAAGSAHGILLDTGAAGLSVTDANINMDANGSGSGIFNKAGLSGIQLNNTTINVGNGNGVYTGASPAKTNSGEINVNGSGSGILFENTDGSMTDQTLDMSDSANLVINVNSAAGNGIVTNASTDLKTGASVNVNDASGGSALIVRGKTASVEQSGKLISASLSGDAVVNIDNGYVNHFTNKGTIQAADTDKTAINTTKGNGVDFTNAADGVISGHVNLLSGNNSVTLAHSSRGTDFTTGSGDDRFILKDITATDTALFSSLQGGTGNDLLQLDNSEYTLSDPLSVQGMERIALINNSVLTLDNLLPALGDNKDDRAGTGYDIESGSTLAVKNAGSVAFSSHLSGAGTLSTDNNGNAFNFTANNAVNDFTGTLALGHSTFDLGGLNTQALSHAVLLAGQGSITTVANGNQQIGGLGFDGGTINFGTVSPGQTVADNHIQTSSQLDLSGRGTVQADTGDALNAHPVPADTTPLLSQDDGNATICLAGSDGTVTGSGGNLTLTDSTGNVISDSVTAGIMQNGQTVANGTWDWRLSSGDNNDGLYINYGLTEVELLTGGDDALVLNSGGATGNAADLSAKVTGSGDLAIDTGTGNIVSLSDMDNDYTGITDVRSGSLLMQNNNVLGHTAELKLASGTGFNMNGYTQALGTISSDKGSLVALNGGHLTLEQGGHVNGHLDGSGSLTLNGGTLDIDGANRTLSAEITLSQGSITNLNDTLGAGTGNISNAGLLNINSAQGVLYNSLSNDGTVTLDDSDVQLNGNNSKFSGLFSISDTSRLIASSSAQLGTAAIEDAGKLLLASDTDWTLKNSVTGDGDLIKTGAGSVTLTADSVQYTGTTDILSGGIRFGSRDNALTLASSQVNIGQSGFLAGNGVISGNTDNQGTLIVGNTPQDVSPASGAGTDTLMINGDLSNSGRIQVGQTTGQIMAGNNLVVNGNYRGNDGHIAFNTVLGDDSSVTDHMTVNGDTSGTTHVSVTNAGGSGAQTLNGIELIDVKGKSDGEFVQEGRIVAGAYDYFLARGTGINTNNWYLNSKPGDPTPGPDPEPDDQTIRPEGGNYTENLAAANSMFVTRLHDRLGETQYIDALTGEKQVTSLWLRQVGTHNRWRDSSGQLKTRSNQYVVMLGGDIARWSSDGLDRGHLGLMAGYGNNHSHTRSRISGFTSDGSVSGYTAGMYGTWYANDAEKTGWYVDTWAQYSWFSNTVNGEQLASESYHSQGVTASAEGGYTLKTGEFTGSKGSVNGWYIQPQAQIIRMGVKAGDHTESNGTVVQNHGSGNIQTRLGIRTFLKGSNKTPEVNEQEFEPFAEVNWIHNTKTFGTSLDGARINRAGAADIAELKIGVEGKLNNNLSIWSNAGQQIGDKGYSNTEAMIGIKYSFR